jgi:hypothetical protein
VKGMLHPQDGRTVERVVYGPREVGWRIAGPARH